MRILSKMMTQEREQKVEELEKMNQLLNPQSFVKYKKELEEKEKYLKFLDTEDIQKDGNKLKQKLQKNFLRCLETKIEKARNQTRSNKINL